MTPEEIKEQQVFSARQMALGLAQQRAKPEDSLETILEAAEKIMGFLMGGMKVAG